MSKELEREQDIRYLYENALAQIHTEIKMSVGKPWNEEGLVERIKVKVSNAMRHDFRAIYPDHTEKFHEEISKRHA